MFFKRTKEAGKAISSSNMEKIQNIHDSASALGAGCTYGMALGGGGGIYEADRDPARIMEAALPMEKSHDALRGYLRDALSKAHPSDSNSTWMDGPYIRDVFPSHVVYDHKGDTMKRSYSVEHGPGGVDPKVTLGEPSKVHTAYVDSRGDVSESLRILVDVPAGLEIDKERFVSKQERDKADQSDFAGKGKSFPIIKAEDVEAALHSIGRAGADNHDSATLKANILRIAKRKGFPIPASDQKESSVIITLGPDEIVVTESATFTPDSAVTVKTVKEGGTRIPVKLIGPGWGSMAYYPADVLKRDGPLVFKKGTQMMWNHQTATQESERPEGDLNDLAAILTKDAEWKDDGPKGPGLYSEAKVFSDYADKVAEKGAHIGVSINAAIRGKEGEMEGRYGRIAEKFVHAFSTDFVTKAGAGGAPIVPVLESQRVQSGGSSMTPEETKAHQDTVKENDDLKKRVKEMEEGQNHILAVATVGAVLKEAEVPFSQRLLETACKNPVMKDGKVDPAWVKETVALFTEDVAGKVTGLGTEARAKESESTKKSLEASLKELGVPEAGLKFAVEGRA